MTGREAVNLLQDHCRKRAAQICANPDLRSDVEQEMLVAMLEADGDQPESHFKVVAESRAIDFLRKELRWARRRLPLPVE